MIATAVSFLILAGCATTSLAPVPPGWPRTVALAPLKLDAGVDPGIAMLRPVMSYALQARGYCVNPVAATDRALAAKARRGRGRRARQQGNAAAPVEARDIGRLMKSDAVLVLSVTEWRDQLDKASGSLAFVVTGQLIDSTSGVRLWALSEPVYDAPEGGLRHGARRAGISEAAAREALVQSLAERSARRLMDSIMPGPAFHDREGARPCP